MALRRRFTRALVFDKLFACPRADPRVLFRTLLQSSAALALRCAGWSAGLTSATCVPSSHCAWRSLFPRHRDHSSSCSGSLSEYGCDRPSRVSPRPPGHDPAEALLRPSAAVAAALGHVTRGQWALLDADMLELIDRSTCLVEPVSVALDDRILSLCLSLPLLWELHLGLHRAFTVPFSALFTLQRGVSPCSLTYCCMYFILDRVRGAWPGCSSSGMRCCRILYLG